MSLISVSGLVLGVAVLVVVLSVMNGFERELRQRVLGILPHGVVFTQQSFVDWRLIGSQLALHPEISGVAPFMEGGGILVANGAIAGINYFGVDPEAEQNVSIIDEYFIEGRLESLRPGLFQVAIGKSLANQLSVDVGEKVTLLLPDAQLTIAGPLPRTKRFVVSGIFEVGSDADKNQILINIEDGLKLNRMQGVNALRIATLDLFRAPEVLREAVGQLERQDLSATSWFRRHGNLYNAIQMQKTTMFLLLLMLVAVAAFNLVSNLVMVVNDKKPDIAILRTIGATTIEILYIFILHGILIGVLGISMGLGLGIFVSNYITEVYAFIDGIFNLGLMDEYFIHYLPAEILVSDLILIGSVSIVICLIVTIYPARMAARANPSEVLQYE